MKRLCVLFLLLAILLPVIAAAERGQVLLSGRKNGLQGTPPAEPPPPGDVEMMVLLQNAGYRANLWADIFFTDYAVSNAQIASDTIELAVISGSSSSSDVPAAPEGVPVLMGEHVTLRDSTKTGYVPFYANGTSSGDNNRWGSSDAPATLTQYIKLVNTSHPITSGIQTDANGLVKILRDPYPNEDAFSKPDPLVTANWYKNYEFGWPWAAITGKAAGLVVLGVSPLDETQVVFAALPKGETTALGDAAKANFVQFIVNENGSGGTRRRFNALNETGRLLFLRSAQWAMGDPLTEPGAAEVQNWDLY